MAYITSHTSHTSLDSGTRLHADIVDAALRRYDWFVLVLSPDAVALKWVKRELLYSLPARPLSKDEWAGNPRQGPFAGTRPQAPAVTENRAACFAAQ